MFLSCDYSQIELRLLAHMADIAALKDAFRDGEDIHAMTASEVFGIPVEGMAARRAPTAPRRSISASSTASAPFGLARQLRHPAGRGEEA